MTTSNQTCWPFFVPFILKTIQQLKLIFTLLLNFFGLSNIQKEQSVIWLLRQQTTAMNLNRKETRKYNSKTQNTSIILQRLVDKCIIKKKNKKLFDRNHVYNLSLDILT